MTALDCAKVLKGEGQHVWQTLGDDTQVCIEKHEDGEVSIIFEGSNSTKDWINNFRFAQVAYKHMDVKFWVHKGFLHCWKLINDEIARQVKELQPTKITVAGHSYGGALAVLCFEDIKYRFPEIDCQGFSFGAPRVIAVWNWHKIKNRWNGFVQYRNCSDIVPCVPLRIMFYTHIRKITQIGDKFCLFKIFKSGIWHSISEYTKNLTKSNL